MPVGTYMISPCMSMYASRIMCVCIYLLCSILPAIRSHSSWGCMHTRMRWFVSTHRCVCTLIFTNKSADNMRKPLCVRTFIFTNESADNMTKRQMIGLKAHLFSLANPYPAFKRPNRANLLGKLLDYASVWMHTWIWEWMCTYRSPHRWERHGMRQLQPQVWCTFQ